MLCRDSMLVHRVEEILRSEILSFLSQATFCNQLRCCEISLVTQSQGDRNVFYLTVFVIRVFSVDIHDRTIFVRYCLNTFTRFFGFNLETDF